MNLLSGPPNVLARSAQMADHNQTTKCPGCGRSDAIAGVKCPSCGSTWFPGTLQMTLLDQPEKSQDDILEFARRELSENAIPDDADPLTREWLHGYRHALAYLIHWIEFPEGGEI